jgi:hypothetical protein
MNTLAEILSNAYSDQGIQDLEVFYDSYFFNLKIKNNLEYNNVLLIEKLGFDYSSGDIKQLKSGITVNFGDSEESIPFYSKGNCFVKSILLEGKKQVLIVGLKQMTNGNTIPIIYLYDINKHSVESIFPKQSDINNFNSFNNYSFKNNNLPIVNLIDDKLYMIYQTEQGSFNYMNSLIFKIKNDSCELTNYEIVEYSNVYNIQFTNINESFLNYKLDNYNGILKRAEVYSATEILNEILLDDNVSALTLDSSDILGIDL